MALRLDFEVYLGPGGDPAELIALLDQAGIDRAVVMPRVQLRPDNRGLVAAVRGYDRLIPCASVNPNFGEEAVQELRTAVTEWGMRGLKLMPPGFALNLLGPATLRVMAVARELAIPVTIHSGPPPGHPLEIAALALRFPEVPIIMDHMGYRDYTGAAIAAAQLAPNIYLGTTLAAFEPGVVRAAVQAVGPTRVVFGSNAPSAYPDLAMESIRRLKLGREAEDLIFGENLRRIYRLPE